MRARSIIAMAVAAFLCGAVALPVHAQTRAQRAVLVQAHVPDADAHCSFTPHKERDSCR